MHRRLVGLLILVLSVFVSFGQIISPEQFLGYKIGTRFTPHWKVVDYFRLIANGPSSTIRLEQYGLTNEGRPLMVAYISSATNIANLEKIRENNLMLAGLSENKGAGSVNTPVIVWLSYNVHGNEAASSEAAMLTLYALADPSNAQTKQWLQNTVVIIDPCLNPDGRERYVNWYNSVVGTNYDPSPEAREHHEPWPDGRSNHYNFDLNRDWVWQTQMETRQRLALYNKWLPQVHVDYHEQGYNSPYYFAPAAEPYHEVITKWQREFQNIIGRNHAGYFDKNNWLYFTKEEFDLLYPSYGDTYPIYNGAIGMTYEQGGIGAGLGIITNYGDTLTLSDRAIHHFTTSMSTIEVSSKNAGRLVAEFEKFFTNAKQSGVGIYKSYVIKYSSRDEERIRDLTELLQRNKISYGFSREGSLRGFDYETGKEETISLSAQDLVIPSQQPKSTLIKVLFEPKAVLADSVTYDITAWSLPYVYGLKAFASTQKIAIESKDIAEKRAINSVTPDTYGYIMNWQGMPEVKLVASLLQKGIKLRYNEEPFTENQITFDRGSVLILKTSNQYVPDLWSVVTKLADSFNVQLVPVSSGFVDKGYDFGSSKIHPLKRRKIALLTGEGVSSASVGEIWFYFDQIIHYPVTLINANDLGRVNWNAYNLIILPNGTYHFLNDKLGADQLKNWITNGGNLIAMENAALQLSRQEWGIKSKRTDDSDSKNIYDPLKTYEGREREQVSAGTPGSIFRVEMDNTHPLAFGFPDHYYTLKQDDNLFEFFKEGGWNVGILKKEKQVSGFVGSRLQNRLQDGLLFGVQDIGRGTITYLADDVLFRSFWENGKLLFSNAVFLVGQ